MVTAVFGVNAGVAQCNGQCTCPLPTLLVAHFNNGHRPANIVVITERLFDLVDQWKPLVVGYEDYSMQAEIQHIEHLQNERNFRFRIKPLGGTMGKIDRIRRLMRLFEQGGIVPPRLRFRTLD